MILTILPDLLLILALALAILLAMRWLVRRRSAASSDGKSPSPPIAVRILRLTTFGLFSFVLVGGGVMAYENYKGVRRQTAPAPSRVEIPEDLPFEVEEVVFTGGDGLKLAGWYVPPENGALVILLHGYDNNRKMMRWHAEQLVANGYGVLMYDERASGESEGGRRSYGWEDAPDVGGALAYLKSRPEAGTARVGIGGCSIGGQIALQGAAYYPEIAAVWADGPAILRAADLTRPDNWATGLATIGSYMAEAFYIARLRLASPPMISIIDDIAPRPIMLVGGGTPLPHFGSEEPSINRYAAFAGENAQVWIIPEALHCNGPAVRPEEYSRRLVEFFNQALEVK